MSELSPEQKYAFSKFTKGENLFITGPGGTGKTHLIKHLVRFAKNNDKRVDVCAMTGCAAVLLNCNATTIHSWSGIKIAKGTKESIISGVLRNKVAMKSWKKSNILIIDEISMLSKKIFGVLEETARIVRKSSLPFGGLQIVFCGDFFQLPPIGTEGEPETEEFCFESPQWGRVFKPENMIELTTIFRQHGDPIYRNILNQVRKGELDEENKCILQSYVGRIYNPDENNGCVPTKLFALRSKTDYVNNMMYSKLNEREHVFEFLRKTNCAVYLNEGSSPIEYDILKRCSQMSSDETESEIKLMVQNIPVTQVLRLKKGCAVMCTVNLDMAQSICNGSQGVVIDFIENVKPQGGKIWLPLVRFSNGVTKLIEQYSWQSEISPNICVSQIPLCLAWALTIHKIQGSTLSIAEIDVGHSIFEYGQTYVALSRVESLFGLYLSSFHAQKIKANPKVLAFYMTIPKNRDYTVDTATETSTSTNGFDDFAYTGGGGDNQAVKIIKL